MTTKELIARLQQLDPSGGRIVQVAVMTNNRASPVAYCSPHTIEAYGDAVIRAYMHLPDNMHTVERRAK